MAHLRAATHAEWVRARSGIWGTWGPVSPEFGDWYARFMYCRPTGVDAGKAPRNHVRRYGQPSETGFST